LLRDVLNSGRLDLVENPGTSVTASLLTP